MAEAARSLVEQTDRRLGSRLALGRPGTIRLDNGDAFDVLVTDFNRDGCRIQTDALLTPGATFSVGMAHVGHNRVRAVWRSADGYGCEFLAPLSPGAVTSAFGSSNISAFPVASVGAVMASPQKWSPRARVALLAGAIVASWSVLACGALAIL